MLHCRRRATVTRCNSFYDGRSTTAKKFFLNFILWQRLYLPSHSTFVHFGRHCQIILLSDSRTCVCVNYLPEIVTWKCHGLKYCCHCTILSSNHHLICRVNTRVSDSAVQCRVSRGAEPTGLRQCSPCHNIVTLAYFLFIAALNFFHSHRPCHLAVFDDVERISH